MGGWVGRWVDGWMDGRKWVWMDGHGWGGWGRRMDGWMEHTVGMRPNEVFLGNV